MSAPQRLTAQRAEIVFAGIVFAVAVLLAACFAVGGSATAGTHGERTKAIVSRDGAVVQTIDLGNTDEFDILLFEDDRGSNLIELDGGRIRVADADCPDRTCVRTGWIERPGQIIACVPHGLTIIIDREGEGTPNGPDAVVGAA